MNPIKRLREKDINRISRNARASLAIEGLRPTSYSTMLGEKMLRGEITEQQAIEAIVKRYSLKR